MRITNDTEWYASTIRDLLRGCVRPKHRRYMRVYVRDTDTPNGYVTIADPWVLPSVTIRLPKPATLLMRTPLELLADARYRRIEVSMPLPLMQSLVKQITDVYRLSEDHVFDFYASKRASDVVAQHCPIRGCIRPQRVS